MAELVETEKIYVRDLQTIIVLYKNNPQFIALLSNPADLTVIFSNIELIYQVNQSLTLSGSKLDKEYRKDGHHQNVGQVFLDMAVSLKIYIPYCSNQPAANDRVQELKQTVQNGLKKMRLHPDSKGLELSGMLIKPLQRLCKYPLLLRVRVEISFSLFSTKRKGRLRLLLSSSRSTTQWSLAGSSPCSW